jgi:hypothetical protein
MIAKSQALTMNLSIHLASSNSVKSPAARAIIVFTAFAGSAFNKKPLIAKNIPIAKKAKHRGLVASQQRANASRSGTFITVIKRMISGNTIGICRS